MVVCRTFEELGEYLDPIRLKGGSVGFVPTMGALHAGHISLVERSMRENTVSVCSIFVNPTQFNEAKDLTNYPRTEQRDFKMLKTVGCDFVFAPSVEEVYPPDFKYVPVNLGPLAEVMEGEKRPGHFNGVMQVITRFFRGMQPTRAYFGEKDYQQLAVIKKMVEVQGDPVVVVGCDIFREASGLAMSSRNELLSPEGKAYAAKIHALMMQAQKEFSELDDAVAQKYGDVLAADPKFDLEYFFVANAADLQSPTLGRGQKRLFVAAWIEGVRLIDNMALNY